MVLLKHTKSHPIARTKKQEAEAIWLFGVEDFS
jgi:hypothetical protein